MDEIHRLLQGKNHIEDTYFMLHRKNSNSSVIYGLCVILLLHVKS